MIGLKNTSHHGRGKTTGRVGALIFGALAPILVWAQCICGFGDGQFTLATISVDGNIADWAAVHADTDNNVCDGPSGGLIDRDAPVQSTGRDLTHFAFTWDQNNVYLFTERVGSPSNIQNFVYYADIDNDGLMETGEPIVGASWQGNNRHISIYVFTYVSQAPAGDPMVDGMGFGDGYTLPGSFANVPQNNSPNRQGTWGSANGLQMEFFVTWAELGLAPGTAFTFHVSSSNAALGANSFTAQIDDNLSGCGGRLGTMQIPGVTFTPNLSLQGAEGQTTYAAHTLTNTGTGPDSFDFSSAISGDYAPVVFYYHDVDNSSSFTPADLLLTDTDGDGSPNTGTLGPGISISVLIAYQVPIGVSAGDTATVQTTAASNLEPLANDSVTDTIEVIVPPALLVTKTVRTVEDPISMTTNPKAIPGADVLYTAIITNEGAGTVDTDSLVITDPVPADGCLKVADIGGPGSGPVQFADGSPSSNITYSFIGLSDGSDDVSFSNDGGITFSYSPVAGLAGCDSNVTHIRINPKGSFAADTGAGSPSAEFSFRVTVN
jgi:hypothetical protein